ncbi:hypothetical protein [Oceanobacillus neutriphilus]|uniref:Uncharacterized protein n=1 Tax=Oceanobacillus neutriphilus TaxID=531815 RepID=A0ABQ2NTD0_9BACI|nr:hypothetical protein [Oceanobacillus neutriphilus]GGP10033.1 hypothetical protein GCM10011346_16520 [Oceanobacillus neutriphilus]
MNHNFDHNREMLHKLINDLPKEDLPKATEIFEKMVGKETMSDEEKKN